MTKTRCVTISGFYQFKFAGFIPLQRKLVFHKVSVPEIESKGMALVFREKSGGKIPIKETLMAHWVIELNIEPRDDKPK